MKVEPTALSIEGVVDFLKETEFFRGTDNSVLTDLVQGLEYINLEPGETFINQGEAGDALYFVYDGYVCVVAKDDTGKETVLAGLSAGEAVGEMALISGEKRSASVYAIRESDVLKFSKDAFHKLLEKHPQAMLTVAEVIAKRMSKGLQTVKMADNVKIWNRTSGKVIYEGALPVIPPLDGMGAIFSLQSINNRIFLSPLRGEAAVEVYTVDEVQLPPNADGNIQLPDIAHIILKSNDGDEINLMIKRLRVISTTESFHEDEIIENTNHPEMVSLGSSQAISLLFDESIGQEAPLQRTTEIDMSYLEEHETSKPTLMQNIRRYGIVSAVVIAVLILMSIALRSSIKVSEERRFVRQMQNSYDQYVQSYSLDAHHNPHETELKESLTAAKERYPDNIDIIETSYSYTLLRFQRDVVRHIENGDRVSVRAVIQKYGSVMNDRLVGMNLLQLTELLADFFEFNRRWPNIPKWSERVPSKAEVERIAKNIPELETTYQNVQQTTSLLLSRIDYLGRRCMNSFIPKVRSWSEFWINYETAIAESEDALERLAIRYPRIENLDEPDALNTTPLLLRLGVSQSGLTSTSSGNVVEEFLPYIDYFRQAGFSVVLNVNNSYLEVLDKLKNKEIELAILNQKAGLTRDLLNCGVPIASRVWRGKTYINCFLYCREESPIITIAELPNYRFAFTQHDLTTGYAMPLLYVIENGYSENEVFAQSYFAGSPYDAISDVLVDSTADAFAADEQMIFLAQQTNLPVENLRIFADIGRRPTSTFNIRTDLYNRYGLDIKSALMVIEPAILYPHSNPELHPYGAWSDVDTLLYEWFNNRLSLLASNEHARVGLRVRNVSDSEGVNQIAKHVERIITEKGFSIAKLVDDSPLYRALTSEMGHYISLRGYERGDILSISFRLIETTNNHTIATKTVEGKPDQVKHQLHESLTSLINSLPLRAEISTIVDSNRVTVLYDVDQDVKPGQQIRFYRKKTEDEGETTIMSRENYVLIGTGRTILTDPGEFTATFEANQPQLSPQIGDLVVTSQNTKTSLIP